MLQTLAREVNAARDAGDGARAASRGALLRALGGVLGLFTVPSEQWLRLGKPAAQAATPAGTAAALSDADIEQRIAARVAARKAKNWAESDRIRDELAAAGVVLEDKSGGATDWRRA